MGQTANFVFGYGSLVDKKRLSRFLNLDKPNSEAIVFCKLKGYRRVWNIAMNNTIDIPNYKYYVNKVTDERPEVYVAFLNIINNPYDTIGGVLFPVSQSDLELLDKRERNYHRIDVSEKIQKEINGTVWTYIGLPKSEKNFLHGLRKNSVVISREYYRIVYDGYNSWGQEALADYLNTTDKPDIPLSELKLVLVKDFGSNE